MRRFVNRLDQAEFVRLLNKQFSAMSEAGSFATAIVTTFFAPTGRLTVCNAGHPRPLLYRAARQQWSFLNDEGSPSRAPARNIPLGLIDIAEYEHFDIALQPGDCLLSYTDALIEARDADGEMLGEKGLLRIVRALGEVAPDRLIEVLLREIEARYPENLSDDDVTALLVRCNGRKQHYSLREKTGALLRFLGSLLRAERPPLPDANLANIGGAIIPALGRRWRARS
jgi:serine phosphatase RsbU (regulator of sigma subunit)